jgi:hypothetical protein
LTGVSAFGSVASALATHAGGLDLDVVAARRCPIKRRPSNRWSPRRLL